MGKLTEEIKSRRLLQTLVVYLGGAWVVVEVTDLLVERYGLPRNFMDLVLIFVIAGIPGSLAIAWFHGKKGGQKITLKEVLVQGTIFVFAVVAALFTINGSDEYKVIINSDNSIAVFPFRDMSPQKDQEYFCDGMAEEIINDLTQLVSLRVVARTSSFQFKGIDVDIREAGEKLNVKSVLEGNVRKDGDKLRITAQLINVSDGYHLWSDTFDRELKDVFVVQDEISRSIVEALEVRPTGGEMKSFTRRKPGNIEAYNYYLKGRYQWNKRTEAGMKKSINYFEQAIEKDPTYALAYAGLADSYNVLGDWAILLPREAYPKAKAAATKALELDSILAEARNSLAWVKFIFDWDWTGAEREFKRAIELNPSYETAHQWYAGYLSAMGRHEEAIAELKRAQELDPLSLIINAVGGRIFYVARQYDKGIKQCLTTLEIDADFYPALWFIGAIYVQKGMYEEAIAAHQKGIESEGRTPLALDGLGMAYAKAGRQREAKAMLDELFELSEQRYVSPVSIARIYTALGEKEQAFEWLEKAYQDHDSEIVHLKVEPDYDDLRSDPKFTELLKKVGFEE